MSDFSSGVKAFITGEYMVKVHFPVDWKDNADVSCYQCKFYSRNTGMCQLTREISNYPTKYIGVNCPLTFTGEISKNEKEKMKNETD